MFRDEDVNGLAIILEGLSDDKYNVIRGQVEMAESYTAEMRHTFYEELKLKTETRIKRPSYQAACIARSSNSKCDVMFLLVTKRLDPSGRLKAILERQQEASDYVTYDELPTAESFASMIFYDVYLDVDVQTQAKMEATVLQRYLRRHETSVCVKTRPRDDYLREANPNSATLHVRRALLERFDDERLDARLVFCLGPLHRDALRPAAFVTLCVRALIDAHLTASPSAMYVLFDLAGMSQQELHDALLFIHSHVQSVKVIFARNPHVHHVTAVMLYITR